MSFLATLAEYLSAQNIALLFIACIACRLLLDMCAAPNDFPLVNKYPSDWTHKKAKAAFAQDARGLIRYGFVKVGAALNGTSLYG